VPTAVLVPIKAFATAKGRLASTLDADARAALARRMAATVLDAAAPLPVLVVTGDDEVAAFARAKGAEVLGEPGGGLNAAVAAGVEHLAGRGFDEAVIAHADLPLATGLAALTGGVDACTLVPDRRGDGTNVLVVPTGAGFRFAYGPGSFARHVAEAERLGLAVRAVRDSRLGWDVDVPEDLVGLEEQRGCVERSSRCDTA
jgi:2-phospho-L-lactate guanylyltransferase